MSRVKCFPVNNPSFRIQPSSWISACAWPAQSLQNMGFHPTSHSSAAWRVQDSLKCVASKGERKPTPPLPPAGQVTMAHSPVGHWATGSSERAHQCCHKAHLELTARYSCCYILSSNVQMMDPNTFSEACRLYRVKDIIDSFPLILFQSCHRLYRMRLQILHYVLP